MRVVLDTNVVLSGILWGGLPGKIIEAWKLGKFQVVVTHEIFAEYQTILKRFAGRHEIDVDDVMQSIAEKALWCAPMKLSEAVCSDPDDDKFIAAAIGGNAKYVVSGDKALLTVGSYGGVEIVTVKRFVRVVPTAQ